MALPHLQTVNSYSGGNKWKGDPEAEAMMTSHSSSPAFPNLPQPLISFTHPSVWQVERFTVMQLKYIQPFFSITTSNREEKKGGGGLQWEQCGEQLRARAQRHVEGIRGRWGLLLSHLDWPPCTWSAQPPLSSGLFYVIVLWLSACKGKLNCRTPCSCVSRLWGTGSLLRCLITSQTELQRLAMIAT